jgi:hypothetical protein
MDPKTDPEVCLYPCEGAACAPTAMGGIPPESQFSWLSARYQIMFGTSWKLMICGVLTSANAENMNSAISPAALKLALLQLLCQGSWSKRSWHLLHANNKHAT